MMDKGPLAQFEKKKKDRSMLLELRLGVCFWFICQSGCATSIPAVASVDSSSVVQGESKVQPRNALPIDVRAELSSNEVAAGSLVVVTLHLSEAEAAAAVATAIVPSEAQAPFLGEFEGISFPFFTAPDLGPLVYEAVLGIPYERKPGSGVIRVQGIKAMEIAVNVIDGHYPSEILHVDGRRVNPTNKKDLARIKREMIEVARIYKKVTPKKFWSGRFAFPIESAVTSPFGSKRIYNGELKNFHPGMDLKAPMETPVYSAAPGIVVLSKNLFYTGNTVMLDHGYGVVTLYAHMNKLKVKKGDVVSKQILLGLSGKTGRVNGPHLHWQAVVHHVKVNPIGLTEVMR